MSYFELKQKNEFVLELGQSIETPDACKITPISIQKLAGSTTCFVKFRVQYPDFPATFTLVSPGNDIIISLNSGDSLMDNNPVSWVHFDALEGDKIVVTMYESAKKFQSGNVPNSEFSNLFVGLEA